MPTKTAQSMTYNQDYQLPDLITAQSFAHQMAQKIKVLWRQKGRCIVHLHGDLGAGKTTFCQHLLASLGVQGLVKSPTYTIIEPYVCDLGQICHADLYRIGDSFELELMGFFEYYDNALMLIEWAHDDLPKPDISLYFAYANDGRTVRVSDTSI